MEIDTTFDDDLARRLPLPLAELYRRAHNAKRTRDRHDTAYCLWEAALKLLGATAVVAYAERGTPAPELAERLRNLARPALGHWWEFVRLLVPVLADAGDEGFGAARDLVLGRARDDLPRSAGLDAALREALDGGSAPGLPSACPSYSTGWCGTATARSATAPPASGRPSSTTGWAAPWPSACPSCWAGSTSWPAAA